MSLLMGEKELKYQRNTFLESLKLYGIPALYYPLAGKPTETHDIYDDIEIQNPGTYSEPVSVRVTFEEVPTTKTLKNLGWYSKSDDNIPILAFVPVQYEGTNFKPQKDDKIEIVLAEYPSQTFLIKDFKGKGYPNVINWVCKLVKLDVDKP